MERLQRILTLCRDITSSIPMNVPLIQQGIDQLFGKGRLQLEIPEEGKAALVPLHRLNRDEKHWCMCLNRILFGLRTMSRWWKR